MLSWQFYRNLENSFKHFLETKVSDDSVTDINGTAVPVRVGRKSDDDWSIPCIVGYFDSETDERLEIGSNNRLETYLFIIEIYASNEGERLDLAKWVKDTINDGFKYYSYSPNPTTPDSPTKIAGSWIHIDFVTNNRVNLGENVSDIDAHRHRISVNMWTTK
ncbi:MAG: hypothetical protein ACTSWG_10435 [Candidatus Helarchaeota archaeon]